MQELGWVALDDLDLDDPEELAGVPTVGAEGGTPVFEDNVEDEDEDAEGCDDEEMLEENDNENWNNRVIFFGCP